MAKIDFYAKVKAMPTLEEYVKQREAAYVEANPAWDMLLDNVTKREMKEERLLNFRLEYRMQMDGLKEEAEKAEEEYKQLKNRHAEELNELLQRNRAEEPDTKKEMADLLRNLGYADGSRDNFAPYLSKAEPARSEKEERQESVIESELKDMLTHLTKND